MAGFRDLFPDDRRGWATLSLWLLLAALLAAFGLMAHDVYDHQGFTFDGPLLTWFHHHVSPARTAVARTLSRIGEPKSLGSVTALLIIALVVVRRWRDAVVFALEVGGAAALDLVSKGIFARPRPTLYAHLVHETNFSFPSGHAMGGMAFFLALHLLLWRSLPRRWCWVGVLGLLLAVAIGVSRPYLQVHYPSDILAGWAFGTGWVLGVHLLTSRRRKRPAPME
ncbi:MAG: phosphatase PAP2 family protein [Deinococcales bacterium]